MRIAIMAAAVLLSACYNEADKQIRRQYEQAQLDHTKAWLQADADATKACAARGGVPVQSSWDGLLKECR